MKRRLKRQKKITRMNKKIIITISVLIVLLILGYSFVGRNSLSTQEIPGLPPDPGKAGKATLEGIDSDGDGVRDDIQRYIALKYPDEPLIRAALYQYARANQATLLSSSREESLILEDAVDLAVECLGYIIEDLDRGYKIYSSTLSRITNTYDRKIAYFRHDRWLGGSITIINVFPQTPAACDFDVDPLFRIGK